MKKYVYFLADSPGYPNEIYANSASEVKQLIMQSIPDESQILRIVEVKDKKPQVNQVQSVEQVRPPIQEAQEDIDPNNFNNANDFFNTVMQTAIKKGNAEENQNEQNETLVEKEVKKPACANLGIGKETIVVEPKYFEEAGLQFKLEGNKLFKRAWLNVSDSEMPEFRVKSKKTNKLIDTDKYIIEKLEWVEMKS